MPNLLFRDRIYKLINEGYPIKVFLFGHNKNKKHTKSEKINAKIIIF